MLLSDHARQIFAPHPTTPGDEGAFFISDTPLIVCAFDWSAVKESVLLQLALAHEYDHFIRLMCLLPFQLRFRSVLRTFCAMDRFLGLRRDLVRDLRFDQKHPLFRREPALSFPDDLGVSASGIEWNWSFVMEGLTLAYLMDTLPAEEADLYCDSLFGTVTKRCGRNFPYIVSWDCFARMKRALLSQGAGWLDFLHVANVLPFAVAEGRQAVRETLQSPLIEGEVDKDTRHPVTTFDDLSLHALKMLSDYKEVPSIVDEMKKDVYLSLSRTFWETIEAIRRPGLDDRHGAIRQVAFQVALHLGLFFERFAWATCWPSKILDPLGDDIALIGSACGTFSVPVIFTDGTAGGFAQPGVSIRLQDCSYACWLEYAFLSRITRWLSDGKPLDCPLFCFCQRYSEYGISIEALRRFCHNAASHLRMTRVKAEPSAQFCTCTDNPLSINTIRERLCPFWRLVSRVFDGFRTVGFEE
jgi:hypothetical protein